MKRSEKMHRLLEINQLQERVAASAFASADERHRRLEVQLARLEDYWQEYSVQLETLKGITSSAEELRKQQNFLVKLNDAIAQQQRELAQSTEQLEKSQSSLRERSMEVEKVRRATASIEAEEQSLERRRAQKEYDELYAKHKR
jgi:flagellar export protein FliJ